MRLIFFIYILVNVVNVIKAELRVKYQWKHLDYDWDYDWQKDHYIKNQLFIPKNNLPIDVARSPDKRVFVTVLKNKGVPASLNVVSDKMGPSGPLLKPYPNWSWHKARPDHQCEGIVGVYRVAIDDCNRLWVLDNGIIDGKQACDEKLMAFNLTTDGLIFKTKIPKYFARNETGSGQLVTPVVETRNKCNSTTVYISDTRGQALIVWDDGHFSRLGGKIFEAEEKYKNYNILGVNFTLSSSGLAGMALSPKICPTGDLVHNCPEEPERYLYFRPLSSISMFGASTKSLRGFYYPKFPYFAGVDVLQSQSVAQAFTSEGVLFFGVTGETGLGCYNFRKPLTSRYFETVKIDSRLQFISGLKIFENFEHWNGFKIKEFIIAMSNSLHKVATDTLNINEINFRIFVAPVKDLIAGTTCDTDESFD